MAWESSWTLQFMPTLISQAIHNFPMYEEPANVKGGTENATVTLFALASDRWKPRIVSEMEVARSSDTDLTQQMTASVTYSESDL